jgi:hypothetical protein
MEPEGVETVPAEAPVAQNPEAAPPAAPAPDPEPESAPDLTTGE